MNKPLTLPDALETVNKLSITACYGYLLYDSRWSAGLPQFENTTNEHMSVQIESDMTIEYRERVAYEIDRQ